MSDAVIVGCISVIGSIICQSIISRTKSKETNTQMAIHEQKQEDGLIEVRNELIEVKKRLDSHNGYAQKFADYSTQLSIVAERQKMIQKDVEYLKGIKYGK